MQGGAMLSVIRMIAQLPGTRQAQRTSMPNGVFNTADGQINITMVRPTDWRPFCEAIGGRGSAGRSPLRHPRRARPRISMNYTRCCGPVIEAKTTAWLAERLTRTRHHERQGQQL